MPIFVILFLVVPLVEIYILIQVGQEIGALPTIGLCVLTALVGGAMLRREGLDTLQRARANLDRGAVPALEILEGLALAVGGALLMTPGFVTDAFGFACLIPVSRRYLVRAAMSKVHVVYGPAGEARPPGGGRRADERRGHRVIEGDYVRRDDGDAGDRQ